MPRGGKRPNSGPKKGAVYQPTRDKIALREALRVVYATHMEEMLAAQIHNAKGIKHLMMRHPDGRFERVAITHDDPAVAEAQIDAALKSGNAFWIYTKDPSTGAWTDLSNRALDKAAEQVQEIKVTGTLDIIARLHAARQRLRTS